MTGHLPRKAGEANDLCPHRSSAGWEARHMPFMAHCNFITISSHPPCAHH
jgi:hypothetical protein